MPSANANEIIAISGYCNISSNINNYIHYPQQSYSDIYKEYSQRPRTFREKLEDEINNWHGNLLKEINSYG